MNFLLSLDFMPGLIAASADSTSPGGSIPVISDASSAIP